MNEIRILQSISHPNIVRMEGYFEDSRNIHLILELSTDGSLYTRIKAGGIDNSAVVVPKILWDVCQAVNYLHTLNPPIVHRDIKPENLLFFGEKIKLADFGSCNFVTDIIKDTVCGTPEYLAPEMILRKGHNEKLDIWCIGILAYELYFGYTPFSDCLPANPLPATKASLFSTLTAHILVIDGR